MPDPTPSPTPSPETPTPSDPPALTTPPATLTPPPTPEPPKPVDAKPAEPVAAVPVKLEDIKFPEGFEPDPVLSKEFIDLMNKADVPGKDRAQQLLDLQIKAHQASEKASEANWQKLQGEWQKEVMSDPEIGGAKWTENQAALGRMVAQFGTEEVKQAFEYTGAGNNPAIVKFLCKVAAALPKEGSPRPGGPGDSGRTAAEILFPMQGKQ